MLASTMQFSSYGRTPDPSTGAYPLRPSHRRSRRRFTASPARTGPRGPAEETAPTPVPSGPNSVPGRPTPPRVPLRTPSQVRQDREKRADVLARRMHEQPTSRCSTHEQPPWVIRPGSGSVRPFGRQKLLRKEVIQPHLPVRLPCYDFVPIASPTFDDSLHKGWAIGFGCYRLS